MWLWEGFLPCVPENSINVSNKKHAKVLTVCHSNYFLPETSNEVLRIKDMILTRIIQVWMDFHNLYTIEADETYYQENGIYLIRQSLDS